MDRSLKAEITEVNLANENGSLAVHRAILHENDAMTVNVIKKSLHNGAIVSTVNAQMESPLHFAALKGRTFIVDQLIKAGGNVNSKNFFNETPLHYATLGHSKIETVKLLLDSGASVNSVNLLGFTPLDLCLMDSCCIEYKTQIELIDLLHKSGAKLHKACTNYSPLYIALESDAHYEVIKLLLTLGSIFDFNDDLIRYTISLKSKVAQILVRHAALIHAENLNNRVRNFKLKTLPEELQTFYSKCRYELENMKTSYVYRCKSIYHLLMGKVQRSFVRNVGFIKAIQTGKISSEFPIYEDLLRYCFVEFHMKCLRSLSS